MCNAKFSTDLFENMILISYHDESHEQTDFLPLFALFFFCRHSLITDVWVYLECLREQYYRIS